jgi:signal transduction histidine kinase
VTGRLLVWWLDPWFRVGTRIQERALRIVLLSGALSVTVLPAMMAWYGIDGWLWPLTFAVVACAPLGIVLVDQLAELGDRVPRDPLAVNAPERARRLSPGIRLLVLLLGLTLGIALAYALMFVVPVLPESDVRLLAKDFRRSMTIVAGVASVLAIGGSWLWYRTEAYRLQSSVDRARFAVLQQQMQPHFLFNALGSLKELIALDPARAEEATQRIADMYRLLLLISKHTTAALEDELELVENYLEIERIRFGDRLTFLIDAAPDVSSLRVPSLMLQTLVENAVKHGIAKARTGGTIAVAAARRADGWLELVVTNTGAPFARKASRTATGLANTTERLALMYGPATGFAISTDPVVGTTVRFAVSGLEVEP